MCQEYHCDCCPDDFPEVSCECDACYHGDQDFEDYDRLLQTNNISEKSLLTMDYRGSAVTCECEECYHGDQDFEDDDRLLQTNNISEKLLLTMNYRGSGPDTCSSKRCCVVKEDLCDKEKTTTCSSSSCTKEPFEEERKTGCKSNCCSANDEKGTKPSLLTDNTIPQQASLPLQSDCCSPCHAQKSSGGDDIEGPTSSTDAACCKTSQSSCQNCCSPNKSQGVTCEEASNPGDPARRLVTEDKCCTSKPCSGDSCESRNIARVATNSPCNDGCCARKPLNEATCQSSKTPTFSLSEDKCCESISCSESTRLSRNSNPVMWLSAEDKCCESKSCGKCKSRSVRSVVLFSSPENICCESKCCSGGPSEALVDECCKFRLLVEDCRYKSVSRVSMTDCSGFYPSTPPPTPPPPNKSGNSEKKPMLPQRTTKLRVQNICCAMEIKLVQDSLEPLQGVSSIAVNVIGRVVYVHHDPEVTSATELVTTLNRMHLGASIMETGSHNADKKNEGLPHSLSLFLVYLLVQSILMMIGVVAFFVKADWYQWVAIAEIVFGIPPVLKKASVSIKTLTLDINILILIAIAGTLAIQEWLEGAAVVYVFSFAEALQELCMHKVQRTISGLMLKAPQVAILADTGECVPVESVTIGTAIAVRPGELIPLDGVVVKGRAAVDESSVSGESVPLEKTVGAKVYSGTVNQNGYLEVETTSDATSCTVSKVAKLVQEAQTGSARTEIAINRFAKYYTPAVVIVAALVVIIPAILGAAGVGTYSQEIKEWGRRALVLLVIACPCALVMSTPIAVVCGITAAARKGALIKGGAHLETLARLKVLAFDKTGTLTEGKFQVVDIECSFGVHERATLRLAAALESKSSHPLAAAIVNEFAGCVAQMVRSQNATLPEVSRFELHEGQGISGIVDGQLVQIGNYEFLTHVTGKRPKKQMEDKYITWCNESKTVIFVCLNGKLAMMVALADTIRPNSLDTLGWLRKLRVQSAMITGDNSRTAMAVKSKLGLDECVADMKPQNKLSWVKDRQDGIKFGDGEMFPSGTRRKRFVSRSCSRRRFNISASRDSANKSIVGMVGDGVNDGPALAAANVGIAMGAGGTALAVEAADVALMSNNLAKIPELVELGRFCLWVVAENIAFSVVLKLVIVFAALAGKAALWMAVLADVLGLLFVILNGMRPLSWKAGKKHDHKNTDIELAFVKNTREIYSYESYV